MYVCVSEDDSCQTSLLIENTPPSESFGEYVTDHCSKNFTDFRTNQQMDWIFKLFSKHAVIMPKIVSIVSFPCVKYLSESTVFYKIFGKSSGATSHFVFSNSQAFPQTKFPGFFFLIHTNILRYAA